MVYKEVTAVGLGRAICALCAAVFAIVVICSPARANDTKTIESFKNFLAIGDYNNANFYLQSGLINPVNVETGQMFYDIFHSRSNGRQRRNLQAMVVLYDYLNRLKPFDLNAEYNCRALGQRAPDRCNFLNDLAVGASVSEFRFFAERGLDLNRVFEGVHPASFDIVDQLGVRYSLRDLTAFSNMGMVFGDELYDPVILAARNEVSSGYFRRHRRSQQLQMPHNYLSVQQFNFMDALVIALANDIGNSAVQRSSRSHFLCQYIIQAASTFQPSFDYLQYVLRHRKTFRAIEIGKRKRSGNTTAAPFPTSCVSLIAGMAQHHHRLDQVVSFFGAQGDVQTARWLLSLRARARPAAPAQPNAAPSSPPAQPAPSASAPPANGQGGSLAPAVLNSE